MVEHPPHPPVFPQGAFCVVVEPIIEILPLDIK
jgi:hypothetical protein